MNCPRCGDSGVESGPNCRVKVELPTESVEKLVCESCAQLVKDNIV